MPIGSVNIDQINYILNLWRTGRMTREAALASIRTVYQDSGTSFEQAGTLAERALADTTGGTRLTREQVLALPTIQDVQQAVAQDRASALDLTAWEMAHAAGTELATDPYTAYLERLGIGGKQFYNPAEQYQEALFDPFYSLYGTEARLQGPGGVMQDPTKQSATFTDFLTRIGGGLAGLTQGALGQMKSIFGATPEQKLTMGYEPGQYEAGSSGEARGGMDPGQLAELQGLMRYGLRPSAGILGSGYAAGRLPQAQQAYYSQKAAMQPSALNTSFLDWLRKNWGLQF